MSASDNPHHALSKAANDLKVDDSPLTLMDLKDDCLLHILNYFSLSQLLNIRKVCQRFYTLADRFRHKFKSFDAVLNTLKIYRDAFVLDIVKKYCPNVESLTLKDFELFDSTIKGNFSAVVKQLKHLELMNCEFSDELGEYFEGALKLESLTIGHTSTITDKFFQKIPGLKRLRIVNTVFNFSQILIKYPSLEELETDTDKYDVSMDIVKLTPSLKVLKLHCYFKIPSIYLAALPNLKSLALYEDKSNDLELLLEILSTKNTIEELDLSEYEFDKKFIFKMSNLKTLSLGYVKCDDLVKLQKLTHLEQLTLDFIDALDKNRLLDVIKNLKNLKNFNLPITEVTFEFIKELIELLKEQADSRPKLVLEVFDVLNEMLHKEELNTLLKENNKIFKMIYDEDYDSDSDDDSDDEEDSDDDKDYDDTN